MGKMQNLSRRKKSKIDLCISESASLHSWQSDVLGILCLGLAIFLLLALISSHPTDPSNLSASSETRVRNAVGLLGSYVSESLYVTFGWTAFFVPLIFIMLSLHLFSLGKVKENHFHKYYYLLKFTSLFGIFISICAGLSLNPEIAKRIPANLINSELNSLPGGLCGLFLAVYFSKLLNLWGANILVITIFLISIRLLSKKMYLLVWSALLNFIKGVQKFLYITLKFLGLAYKSKDKRQALTPDKAEKPREKTLLLIEHHREEIEEFPEYVEVSKIPTKEPKILDTPKKEVPSLAEVVVKKSEYKPVSETYPKSITSKEAKKYTLPPLDILQEPIPYDLINLTQDLQKNSKILEEKLRDFGVEGRIVQVQPGPVVTRYEFQPAPGVKIARIINLSDDLALVMKASFPPRIAPVPGKAAVGIEIPNQKRQKVLLKEILSSEEFLTTKSKLTLALGKDISGTPYVTDLERMPHLLIAGATGSGKSVCLNCIICGILYNASPEEVQFILVDPKMLELIIYNDIPHLREDVVTEPKKASIALEWAVREMEDRYRLLAEYGARNIKQFNALVHEMQEAKEKETTEEEEIPETLPHLVIIIDELADLMVVCAADLEISIMRLAQMARAAGIHLILATQRPSVNVITGVIKANFPSRISFQVSSKVDSRTILDANGAEKLLGLGDMLFMPPGSSRLERIHGALITEAEIHRLVSFWSQQKSEQFKPPSIFENVTDTFKDFKTSDELYEQAVELVVQNQIASISLLQRRFRIGHSRAARLIDMMEQNGIVGPFEGSKTREVLVDQEYLKNISKK